MANIPLSIAEKEFTLSDENGKELPVTLHDADTAYTNKGVRQRLIGVDAAETPKITKVGGFSAGSTLGIAQTEATAQIMRDYGFNKRVVLGKEAFGGDLVDYENAQGERLSSFLTKNRIVQPTAQTSDADMVKRSWQMFQDAMNTSEVETPVQKSRRIVDSVLSEGTIIGKPQADTIEEYQDYKSATSNLGLAQQEANIQALKTRLLSPKINELQRQELTRKLSSAMDFYQANLNAPKDLYRSSLEGTNFKGPYGAQGEMERAWDIGMLNVSNSAANILDYIGNVTGSKELEYDAKGMLKKNERAKRLVDTRAGDVDITGGTTTSLDDVEKDFSKIFRFIGSSTLQYGPQMGVMIAGSLAGGTVGLAVGGPVGAFIGSSIVPMAMGIGDVYGEMPDDEKDPLAAAAIGSVVGLVDRLGLPKGAIKGVDLLTKAGISSTATKIAAAKGIPVGEATKLLHKEVLQLGKDYAIVAKNVAVNQLKAKENLADLLLQITKNSGKESATETLQEAIQYAGVRSTTSLDFDYNELYNRAKEAAVVGGLLGAEIGTPSAMMDRSNFNYQLNMLSGVETKPLTSNAMMEQEELKRHGKKLNDIELAAKLRSYAASGSTPISHLDLLITPGTKPISLAGSFKDLLVNGGLFSSVRDNVLSPFLKFQGGREIAGLFDASSVRGVYSGMSAFKRIHNIANGVMNSFMVDSDKRKLFGTTNNKDIGTRVLNSYTSNTNDPASLAYRQTLNQMGEDLANQLDDLGLNTGWSSIDIRQPDYFLKNQLVDPNLVRANVTEFIDTIENNYKSKGITTLGAVNKTYLKDLADRISDNLTYKEMKELADLGMLDNPVLNKFRSKDVEHNAVKMIEMISRSAVKNTIFGANGEVVGNGIKKMLDSGEITAEEASELAMHVKELIAGFDGTLNKPKSPLIRGATENLTFATTMVYMDTSLFANLSEIVYGALGLSKANIVKYFGLIAKEFASDVAAKFTQVGNKISGGLIPSVEEKQLSKNISLLQLTGQSGKMNDIAFNVGANITSQSKRNMSKLMFKFNLVESATNAARAARGAIACDEINNMISIIAESPNNNDATRWARDRLSYYRMDPDELVSIYNSVGTLSLDKLESLPPTHPMFNKLSEQLNNGITNFIDEFSSRPEPGSTAKIFDDHRFALITQFQKFTWHFTSNVIPQLWGMYIKRGKPEYTYSAFSLMILAYATAYAGLYLKSMLRGEDEEDDEKKLSKRLGQAASYASSSAQIDMFNKISSATETRADGSLKTNPFKTLLSQSPSLNLGYSSGKDAYKIATEEGQADLKAKSNLIRRVPVFGEIPAIRNMYEKEK